MGGKRYECKGCGDQKYIYFGCGNTRCPKCQGLKRMQWQQKLTSRLYQCPYQHIVFTLPSELRVLARRHPSLMYNILMRSAWQSLKKSCADQNELGARPGAVMVLHTFGSDLKYHVHVHSLVTFGGIDTEGKWRWPKRKNKIVGFRKIRRVFRLEFLKQFSEVYSQLDTHQSYEELYTDLTKKQWCVHQEPPTANAKTITQYLSKYINRIGLSIQRFAYDQKYAKVILEHKDYRSQNQSQCSPMISKEMQPMTAIHQIMQHCLPLYFQKTRYYGIHSSACSKKYKDKLPKKIMAEGRTIKSIIQLISQMLGYDITSCQKCGSSEIKTESIKSDNKWILRYIKIPAKNKDPTKQMSYNPYSKYNYKGNGDTIPAYYQNSDNHLLKPTILE